MAEAQAGGCAAWTPLPEERPDCFPERLGEMHVSVLSVNERSGTAMIEFCDNAATLKYLKKVVPLTQLRPYRNPRAGGYHG